MLLKLSVFFAGLILLSSCACGALVDIDVSTNPVRQGSAFLVSVAGPEVVRTAKCLYRGREIPLFTAPVHGTLQGIGMIDAKAAPGEYRLTVSGVDCAGEKFEQTLILQVMKADFKEIHLKVASAMATPSEAAQRRIDDESRLLKDIMSKVSERKFRGMFKKPVPGIVTSPFGTMRIFNGQVSSFHTGTDFRGHTGTPVTSVGSGRVVLVKPLYLAGNTVIVDHGLGIFSLYGHLDSTELKEGDRIETGGLIGRLGATGRVTAPHLHLGVKVDGSYVDSSSLFKLPLVNTDSLAPVAMSGYNKAGMF